MQIQRSSVTETDEFQRAYSGTNNSLAQYMANKLNVTVYALLERSEYKTLYSPTEVKMVQIYAAINALSELKTVNGHKIAYEGSVKSPFASDSMPYVSQKWWVFKKGKPAKSN